MEPNQQEVAPAPITNNPAFKVTPLSKYFAMILFILMPFVGGYIGYAYAPEKVVEIEKVVVPRTDLVDATDWKQDSTTPYSATDDRPFPATRERIETIPNTELYGGQYLDEARYVFENGFYTLSFTKKIGYSKVEQFSDPNMSDNSRSFMNYYYYHNEDGTVQPALKIDVHLSSYCHLSLCEKETVDVVMLPDGNEWEFLGEYEYCDVGHCSGNDFTYRRTIGDYVMYLGSETSLHDPAVVADNVMLPTLKTFKFELSNR
jgi:hypothetical protein